MGVILLGGTGMLGQEICRAYAARDLVAPTRAELDVSDLAAVRSFMRQHRTDDVSAVINAAGAIPGRTEGASWMAYARANALGASYVAKACAEHDMRLVHVSTDCVFSGDKRDGPYVESDKPDNTDNGYGHSKLIGEAAVLNYPRALVVRTSFIGPSHGFLRWLRDVGERGGKIELWQHAAWSGSTAREVARAIVSVAGAPATGTMHLTTGDAISKAALAETCWKLGLAKRVPYVETDLPVINRWLATERADTPRMRPLVEALEEYA